MNQSPLPPSSLPLSKDLIFPGEQNLPSLKDKVRRRTGQCCLTADTSLQSLSTQAPPFSGSFSPAPARICPFPVYSAPNTWAVSASLQAREILLALKKYFSPLARPEPCSLRLWSQSNLFWPHNEPFFLPNPAPAPRQQYHLLQLGCHNLSQLRPATQSCSLPDSTSTLWIPGSLFILTQPHSEQKFRNARWGLHDIRLPYYSPHLPAHFPTTRAIVKKQ